MPEAAAELQLVPAADEGEVLIEAQDVGDVGALVVGVRIDHPEPGAGHVGKPRLVERIGQAEPVGVVDVVGPDVDRQELARPGAERLGEEGRGERPRPGGHGAVVADGTEGHVAGLVEHDGRAVVARPVLGPAVSVRVAPEVLVAARELVVDPDCLGMIHADRGGRAEVVGRNERVHVGQRRLRGDAVEVLRQRAHPGLRDDVVGKRLPLPGRGRGPRVVERDLPARRIDQAGEVSLAHRHRRHGHAGRRRGEVAVGLVGEEEERALAAVVEAGEVNRTSGRGPELVAHQVRRLVVVVLATPGDADRAVAVGFEERTVQVVRPAAGRDDGRRGPVHPGRGVAGFHLELVDRVQAGRAAGKLSGVAVGQDRAVLQELHRGRAQAEDPRARGGAFETGCGLLHDRLEEAPVERELFDARALDRAAERRIRRRHERRDVADDRDLGRGGREPQRRLDHGRLADLELQLPFPALHARHLDRDLVGAGLERRKDEEPRRVGHGVVLPGGLQMNHLHVGAGDDGARRVLHGTLDAPGADLSEGARGPGGRDEQANTAENGWAAHGIASFAGKLETVLSPGGRRGQAPGPINPIRTAASAQTSTGAGRAPFPR